MLCLVSESMTMYKIVNSSVGGRALQEELQLHCCSLNLKTGIYPIFSVPVLDLRIYKRFVFWNKPPVAGTNPVVIERFPFVLLKADNKTSGALLVLARRYPLKW